MTKYLLALLLLVTPALGNDPYDPETDPNAGLKMIQFTAEWCGPCKQMEPAIQRLAVEGYPVLKCDIDMDRMQGGGLSAKFAVKRIPTIVILHNGKLLHRWEGVQSFETMAGKMDQLRKQYPDEPVTPDKPDTPDDDSGLPIQPQRVPYKFQ